MLFRSSLLTSVLVAVFLVIFHSAFGYTEDDEYEDEDDDSTSTQTRSWSAPGSEILKDRINKIIEAEQKNYRPKRTEKVLAPTCVKIPTSSDFFDVKLIREAKKNPKPAPPEVLLSQPSAKINDIFKVLQGTDWGNAILLKFMPRFGFDVKVEHYSEKMKQDELQKGRYTAAIYDPDTKTIYVDKSEEIGRLAPILLHEIIHSLDQEFTRSIEREKKLWKEFDSEINRILNRAASRNRKTTPELQRSHFSAGELNEMRQLRTAVEQFRDVRIYRAERIAYDMYYLVALELARKFPTYYNIPRNRETVSPFSDKLVITAEHLNPDTIDRYRRGLCVASP